MFKGIIAVLATTAVVGTAAAVQVAPRQQHGPDSFPSMGMARGMMTGGMMGQGVMGSGMMGMMGQGMGVVATGGPGAAAMLSMREGLGLTDEQVGRLEAIRDEFARTAQPQMNAMMASHAAAATALKADPPDLDAYQQGLQAAANIMVQTHVAMARSQLEAQGVLTPEQLERLEARGSQMMGHAMEMHGWGGTMMGH